MSKYRSLILGNKPVLGKEFSNFNGEERFESCSIATGKDALRFIEKAKHNDLFLEECDIEHTLANELEEAWGEVPYDSAVGNVREYNSFYALSVKRDEVGYIFRIVNEVGAKTWGVLENN